MDTTHQIKTTRVVFSKVNGPVFITGTNSLDILVLLCFVINWFRGGEPKLIGKNFGEILSHPYFVGGGGVVVVGGGCWWW